MTWKQANDGIHSSCVNNIQDHLKSTWHTR